MNQQKQKRRRGVILTSQGLQKLQTAKSEAESYENFEKRYTLETLSFRTGLDPDTLMKVFAQSTGVDKRTLKRCFMAFNLSLEPSDYQLPQFDEATSTQHQIQHQIDWGAAPDVSIFYGRTDELATLKQSIVEDRCRMIALLGMGGMGKTYLSLKLAEQIQDEFDFVIWRSLLQAPPIKEFLAELIRFLSQEQDTNLPATVNGRISRLMHYLRASRCLLVLDDVETILEGCNWQQTSCNKYAGRYGKGYEGYGELLRRIGEVPHQSCLMLTSREKPKEISLLAGETLPVRVLQVKGLQVVDIQAMFSSKGSFWGSTADWNRLIERYAGNPLALKIVATTIQELFDGRICEFLKHNTVVFGKILNLVEQQFRRLSDTEKEIITWLASNHQPTSFSQMCEQISCSVSVQTLLEALESLEARCLLDKAAPTALFSVQPMVREYVANQLIEENIPKVRQKVFSGSQHQRVAAIS